MKPLANGIPFSAFVYSPTEKPAILESNSSMQLHSLTVFRCSVGEQIYQPSALGHSKGPV